MHICKVAHMDLKPQNIVIDQYLNAKIVDFSTSLIYKKEKPEDYIKFPYVGTSKYMSPEILKSDTIKVKDLNYSSYFLDFLSKLLEKDIERRISMSDALNHYWINGGRLLLDEQEKLFNDEKFLSYLLSDYISDFNTYIRKANKVKI